ncbi:hypothetical protein ACO1O0_000598 [Amphichorda felina]
MVDKYGPLVRLWGIQNAQLPARNATAQELTRLLTSILLEAVPFISDVPSAAVSPYASSWKTKGSRHFPHSEAPVFLYERTVPAEALHEVAREHHLPGPSSATRLQPETWFLRRSVHDDSARAGTASWDEWVRCFKASHAETERAFTPSVLSTRADREWDCRGVEVDLDGETWGDWTLKLEESVHKMPAPLRNRVFPVLQATTSVLGKQRFLVVQIAAGEAMGVVEARRGGDVCGAYTSIEQLRDTGEGIEWVMGTASDAKGVLPAWVQRMATPGMVAKDVDLFLSWVATHRREEDDGDIAKDDGTHNGSVSKSYY